MYLKPDELREIIGDKAHKKVAKNDEIDGGQRIIQPGSHED